MCHAHYMNKEVYERGLKRIRALKRVENMCDKLKKLAGKSADDILKEVGMDNAIPVNMDELMRRLNIKVYDYDFDTLEKTKDMKKLVNSLGNIWGMVLTVEQEIVIFLRKGLETNGKRFTIAHELAHCCLDGDNLGERHFEFRTTIFSADPCNKKEIKANTFAGELLMPEKALREYCSEFIVPEVNAIANKFKVSVAVAEARLKHLKITYMNLESSN